MYTILTTMIHLSAKETSPFSISIHLLVPIHHSAVPPVWFPPHREPQDPGVQPCFVSAHCEETLSPRPLTYTLLGRLCGNLYLTWNQVYQALPQPLLSQPTGFNYSMPSHCPFPAFQSLLSSLSTSRLDCLHSPSCSRGMFLTTLVLPTCTIIPTCPARFQSQSSHPPT